MKLTENKGSYKVVLPKHMVKELGWEDKKDLQAKRVGKRIIISEVLNAK